MNKASTQYVYSRELHEKWRMKRGIDPQTKCVLTKTKRGAMYFVSLEEAIQNHWPIHEHINLGKPTEKTRMGKFKRLKSEHIDRIINFGVDGEYAEDPPRFWRVFDPWYRQMIKFKWFPKEQDVEDTGAGGHLIGALKDVIVHTSEERTLIFGGIKYVYDYIFMPEWDEINENLGFTKKNGLYIPLTCLDPSHPVAPAGTVRFPGNKKNESKELSSSIFMRCFRGYPDSERKYCDKIRAVILNYKMHPPKTTTEFYEMQASYSDDIIEQSVLDDLVQYNKERIPLNIDRSTRMCKLLYYCAKEFNYRGIELPRERALVYAEFIHDLSGRPHPSTKEAIRQAQFALRKWTPPIWQSSFLAERKYNSDIILEPEKKEIKLHISNEQEAEFDVWTDMFVEVKEGSFIEVEKVQYQYQQWCERLEKQALGEKQFSIAMGKKFKVIRKLKQIDGKRSQYYIGLNLKFIKFEESNDAIQQVSKFA